jgi:tetratricopeptide (TPR) repeat protein
LGRKHLRTWKCIFLCAASIVFLTVNGCATVDGLKSRYNAYRHIELSQKLLVEEDYEGALSANQKALSMAGDSPPGDKALFNSALVYAHHNNPNVDFSKSRGYMDRLIQNYPDSPLREQAIIWEHLLKDIEKSEIKLEKSEIKLEKSEFKLQKNERDTEIRKNQEMEKNRKNNKNNHMNTDLHLLKSQKFLLEGKYQEALAENEKILEMSGKSPFRDRALFNIGLVYAHQDNPEKDYAKSLQYFTKIMKEYPDSPLVVQAGIWQSVINIIEKAKQVDIDIEEKKKELTR